MLEIRITLISQFVNHKPAQQVTTVTIGGAIGYSKDDDDGQRLIRFSPEEAEVLRAVLNALPINSTECK